MPTLDEVRDAMRSTGAFTDDALQEITQGAIDDTRKATPLPQGSYPPGVSPLYTTWTGNNFRIVSGKWFWDDTPGSMCGRTRTWEYTPRPGASYRQVARCPQGYWWYEMQIP